MDYTKEIETIRQEIYSNFSKVLGKDIFISDRAGICLENTFLDKNAYSWQLKLLNTIFQTTPVVYRQVIETIPEFEYFDYNSLEKIIVTCNHRKKICADKSISSIAKQLFEEPQPEPEILVLDMGEYSPKKDMVDKVLSVDNFIELLFHVLHFGGYISDLALAMLSISGRELHQGKVNRRYLEEFEGFNTSSEKIDESYSYQQWIIYNDGKKYKIKPFGAWGVNQLQDKPLKDGSLWIARGNVLQPPTKFSEEKIERFEYLINTNALEKDFQKFFEKNPEFLIALGDYKGIHSQLILKAEDGNNLIPDFFLEKLNSDFCDIIDLKRPSFKISKIQKNRNRFRDIVMEGVSQLENYRNWFEDKKNRDEFHSKYGLKSYRPKVVLILGRQKSIFNEIESIRTQSILPNHFELRTYDEVLNIAKNYLRKMI